MPNRLSGVAIRRKREIPLLTAAVSFAAVSLVLAWIVVDHYGGASFFPGLAAGFLGTFVGFVLALTADRERERRRAMSEAADLMAQRQTEVRRRLQSVRAELVRLDEMIGSLVKELQDEVADLVDRVGQQIDQPERSATRTGPRQDWRNRGSRVDERDDRHGCDSSRRVSGPGGEPNAETATGARRARQRVSVRPDPGSVVSPARTASRPAQSSRSAR